MGAGTLSWDLVNDLRQLLSFHFMLNAMRAGTVVAIVAGAIGYFMVLRRQSFVGRTIAAALAIAALPGSGRADSGLGGYGEEPAIGPVQGVALATGFLFAGLYQGFSTSLTSLLFGSIIGITDDQVITLLIAGTVCLVVLVVIGRPLLVASVDPEVARANGVPVRLLNAAFLMVLAMVATGTSQVTGSLLVFALLVVWVGEGIGFWVTTLAFALFLLATVYRAASDARGRRRLRPDSAQAAAA